MDQEKAIILLNQLIEKAEEEDKRRKIHAINSHKAQQAVGEGWMLFHLKKLKDLLAR